MDRNEFDDEMQRCPHCRQAYSSFYDSCPYCQAEKESKIINRYGRMDSLGLRIGTLLLSLALAAGGVVLCVSLLRGGIGTFGREYAPVSREPETVQVNITEQEVAIAVETIPVDESGEDETAAAQQEDGTADPEDEESEPEA